MLRIVSPTVPRVGLSYENFPDGFELHLLRLEGQRVTFDPEQGVRLSRSVIGQDLPRERYACSAGVPRS